MATIQSQLRLNDGMSAVLRNVTAALDTCLRSFEEMRAASGSAMDVSAIAEARVELLSANNTIEQMERNSRDAENAQRGYNRAVQAGNSSLDGMLSKVKGVVATLAAASGVRNPDRHVRPDGGRHRPPVPHCGRPEQRGKPATKDICLRAGKPGRVPGRYGHGGQAGIDRRGRIHRQR